MREAVRRAGAPDLARLAELATEARAEQLGERGGAVFFAADARPRPADGWLADAIDDPDQLVAVGTIDETVVGYAVVARRPRRDGLVVAELDELYVEPGARSVGVGEQLIDAVVAWATEQGCHGVDAWALPGNRATKNFFETFGLTARAIRVHRTLAEVDPEVGPEVGPEAGDGAGDGADVAATPPAPVVCVGAVAVRNDELLVVRRGHAPEAGRWSLPGGRVHGGELLAEAVVRELAEETGLEGVCGPLVGWAERFWDDVHVVVLDFEVTVLDPEPLVAGDDAAEARWVHVGDVADLDLAEGLAEFLHEHGVIPTIT